MIGVRPGFVFFDSTEVERALREAERKALSKFGAFVMTTARRSIRKPRKGGLPSEPGKPPRNQTGRLKNRIFFGYDLGTRSVVIGPEGIRSAEAPPALEYGGPVVVRSRRTGGRPVRVTIEPRPYMAPAFERELPRAPDLWANAVIG